MVRVTLVRNGGYWSARWRDQDGKEMSRGLGSTAKVSRRKAEGECRRIEHEVAAGRMAAGRTPTLAAFIAHFRATRDVQPSTAVTQDISIDRHILPHFGNVDMGDVTLADAERWLAKIRTAANSDYSAHAHLRMARLLWNSAARHTPLPNPFSRVTFKCEPIEVVVPPLTQADVLRLIECCPSPAWKALIGLCALAGTRLGEATLLTWDGVQFDRNRIMVPQPKTARRTDRKDRPCLLDPDLSRVLSDVLAAQPGPLVVGKGLRNMQRDFWVIAKRAGLPKWPKPFHGLRKWRVSTWKLQYPEAYVDRWLGHGAEVSRKHYFDPPEYVYGTGQMTEIERLRRENEALKAQAVQS